MGLATGLEVINIKFRLSSQLSLSYVLLALFLVGLISVLTNVFFERQFKEYIIIQQETKNKEFAKLIGQQFDSEQKIWNQNTIEDIGVSALEQGLIVKVEDLGGSTVWDATVHNNGLCIQMIDHMAHNMTERYPGFKGNYMVNKYPLEKDGLVIGNIYIGYYGPYFFTDNDLAFINTFNKMAAITGLLSLLLALILGNLTARRLSAPISKACAAARGIGSGNYNCRIGDDSNILEIEELTSTVNELADGLEKQERLRKRLTADVAHEMRTPLATLQSHIEAMIDGIWAADKIRLESCHEEVLRISRMVGDLEKLARYEGENLVLNKEKFDLLDLVRQLFNNFQAEFHNKKVILDLHGEPAILIADRDKISQVIVNLLSNAMKYTSMGDVVELKVESDFDRVVLRVKDTGTGIDPEDLPHVFERFYRADKSRTRETGGAGIGLAIVKAIVNAHEGFISVDSIKNQGTTFTVTLPRGKTG